MDKSDLLYFRKKLLEWSSEQRRPLPWKGEKDPYLIWLSEIILQQTRVEQGLPYFERFKKRFPKVEDLASASEDEVFKLWEGLGYYSRARNLHHTAKYIAGPLGGQFPYTYGEILKLKGVGPYTAAAIASFAFDLPHAVVDGNVFRVLARFLAIETPIDGAEGKKRFREVAQEALDPKQAARYNQAIMDFGALQCTPRSPDCTGCVMQERCRAFALQKVGQLPVKQKSIRRKQRFFHFLLINKAGKVAIRKRQAKDIWRNLYEFPLIELENMAASPDAIAKTERWRQFFPDGQAEITQVSPPFRQTLTHQIIHATFWEIEPGEIAAPPEEGYLWVERKKLKDFAFPKTIDLYLRDKTLYLKLL